MDSIKCSQCGLTSFRTADHCRGCNARLTAPPPPVESQSDPPKALPQSMGISVNEYVSDDPKRPSSFSPLRVLLLILMVAGPGWYFIDKYQTEVADKQKAEQVKQRDYTMELDKKWQNDNRMPIRRRNMPPGP